MIDQHDQTMPMKMFAAIERDQSDLKTEPQKPNKALIKQKGPFREGAGKTERLRALSWPLNRKFQPNEYKRFSTSPKAMTERGSNGDRYR